MTCRSLSILVTGAAGYIGSALVRELLAQGHRVTAVDSMLFGDRALAELMQDDASGLLTALFRWQPGTQLPLHEHVEVEHIRQLEAVTPPNSPSS